MLTDDLLAFVRSALPPPPLRVLEVGAGGGELAAALTEVGYDMTAVDPAAEPTGLVKPVSLLDVRGTFDAAVSVVALHHVAPLEESCAHLATLVRPEGTLVVDEIDSDRFDERAAAWWLGQRRALGYIEEHATPATMLADLRHHIAPLSRVRNALAPFFELGQPVRGPYLHRWELSPRLYEHEVELIARGTLPAIGARLVGNRMALPTPDRKARQA
jgi:SAM-dependent methyltransferase